MVRSKAGRQILWISPSDPWSRWTLSGISREICLELDRRGLLWGATGVADVTSRHVAGPGVLHALEGRLVGALRRRSLLGRPRFENERDGRIGRLLRRCPAGTVVVYALVRPELDPSLDLRRFRWMDLSVVDAARTGTFGYAGRSEDELQAHISDERRFLSACEGVVSLSTYAADSISRDLGYDRARIAPIGAGPALDAVPDVRFDPARYGAARVLFVGRDWERKGGRLILEGFRRLRTEVTHATLTVVGPSENPAPGEPGLVYVGALDKTKPSEAQKLQEFFLNSSLLCMASVSEPWGLVYVEAARYGLPVVALDTWAVPDIVVDGSTGVLIAEPEAEQLGDALRVVCTQPEASAQMGRAAKVRVESVLAWPAVVDRLLQHVLPASVSGREVLPLRGVATGAAVA